eukprot:458154-Amorphochlora_amoeboformis.AAC.1
MRTQSHTGTCLDVLFLLSVFGGVVHSSLSPLAFTGRIRTSKLTFRAENSPTWRRSGVRDRAHSQEWLVGSRDRTRALHPVVADDVGDISLNIDSRS